MFGVAWFVLNVPQVELEISVWFEDSFELGERGFEVALCHCECKVRTTDAGLGRVAQGQHIAGDGGEGRVLFGEFFFVSAKMVLVKLVIKDWMVEIRILVNINLRKHALVCAVNDFS
ncbi:hypothetical protein ACS49_02885 [Bacillus cereus]|nr:hypothetical protein ACS49_02885 [Bacillus cereus]